MDFPTAESDILALTKRMLDGYLWHGGDFPHVTRVRLVIKRDSFTVARKNLRQAQANLRIQAKAAEKKLSELVKLMRNCLQKSEVDVAGNPEKLKQIGWGPRANPQPAQAPGQPADLQITAQENQTVKLQWERPADDQRVRNYIIERRQPNGDGIGDWPMIQISYSTQATMRNQPLGIQLEYRVRAANTAGTGPFSNTVSVLL